MAGTFSQIDLSQLPEPVVVEQIDFDVIKAAMVADMQARMTAAGVTWNALVESDPVMKEIEVAAYRETIVRQRANDASVAVMLAYAEDADLDQLGANVQVARLVVTPEDDTTTPVTAAVMESDPAYRARIQLSFNAYSTCGSVGAYTFFALSASGQVKDVSVTQPTPGTVLLSILSNTGDGTSGADFLAAVTAATSDETVRPLCDTVEVQSAEILNYKIEAVVEFDDGADQATLLPTLQTALQKYVDATHKNGGAPKVAGIAAALWTTGVSNVVLVGTNGGITADMTATKTQASYCTGIIVTGADDD